MPQTPKGTLTQNNSPFRGQGGRLHKGALMREGLRRNPTTANRR
jgi:hypothetical protein